MMYAAQFISQEKGIQFLELPDPAPKSGEVIVELKAAALNRRDFWITKGLYPGIRLPVILGSDGCASHEAQRFLLNPNQKWGPNEAFQAQDYTILGTPENGTFCTKMAIPEKKLFLAPDHLSDVEAAALPLAGMTAFRALVKKCQPKRGEKVLITGIGGGVALMAFQFARALECKVFVTSGSDEKLEKAMELGADGTANYKVENWDKTMQKLSGGVDVIIDGAGGKDFPQLLKICNPGARIAVYGGTAGKIEGLSPQVLFWKQITLFGTTMASDLEFGEMVQFVKKHQIRPVIDSVLPLDKAEVALKKLGRSEQFGKIVLVPPKDL